MSAVILFSGNLIQLRYLKLVMKQRENPFLNNVIIIIYKIYDNVSKSALGSVASKLFKTALFIIVAID